MLGKSVYLVCKQASAFVISVDGAGEFHQTAEAAVGDPYSSLLNQNVHFLFRLRY